ncbi:MAG: 50S ribosomal protein L3 [Candidatus Euphemobacter frigidus]|nr:50S ribosomal protein L3 [Candidatus Euphemobacter frigidus]MDP8276204.1 50S ribosomal protein L3 [Candidatus Euphemobacter frigidus]
MAGLLGKKMGMTQVFTSTGNVVPVTVIQAGPCTVLEVLTEKGALKIGFGETREERLKKPQREYFKKIGAGPQRYIREIKFTDVSAYQTGQEITTKLFEVGDYVDVTGRSKGRGFSGVIKRWGHSRFPASHGHPRQRLPGSQGCSATPARVFKGRKLPGRYGGVKKTVQNLKVIEVRPEENLLLIKGAVPGARSGLLLIRKAIKKERR